MGEKSSLRLKGKDILNFVLILLTAQLQSLSIPTVYVKFSCAFVHWTFLKIQHPSSAQRNILCNHLSKICFYCCSALSSKKSALQPFLLSSTHRLILNHISFLLHYHFHSSFRRKKEVILIPFNIVPSWELPISQAEWRTFHGTKSVITWIKFCSTNADKVLRATRN